LKERTPNDKVENFPRGGKRGIHQIGELRKNVPGPSSQGEKLSTAKTCAGSRKGREMVEKRGGRRSLDGVDCLLGKGFTNPRVLW